jgi:pentalenic acid synthase
LAAPAAIAYDDRKVTTMAVSDVQSPDAGVRPAELPDYPLLRQCPYRPHPGMAALRDRGPISRVRLYDGRTTWLVTGPAEIRALLADPRVSNRSDFPDYPVMEERHKHMRATREMAKEEEGGFASALFGVDPPEHTRQRQMLVPAFTVRKVAALRPELQRIIDERLDAMLAQGPPADLVSDFSGPVPMMAVCLHLGVPWADRARFEGPVRDLFVPERAERAMVDLNGYLEQLVAAKQARAGRRPDEAGGRGAGAGASGPGDGGPHGLLDDLIANRVASGALELPQLMAFAQAILVAGSVTTSSVIALGTLALLDTGQYAALAADPDLIPGAVEELLRHVSLVEQLARVATEDIEIGGVTIKAGDGLIASFAAANLDLAVTSHPDRLDITSPPVGHLAFSHGIHHCLGQNLARLELEIAFRALTQRVPTLRSVLPVDQIPTHRDGDVQRLTCFPVTW